MKKESIIRISIICFIGISIYLINKWSMANSYILVKDTYSELNEVRSVIGEHIYTRKKCVVEVYYDEIPSENIEKEMRNKGEIIMDKKQYEELINYVVYKKHFFIAIKEGHPRESELEIKYGFLKKHVYLPTGNEEFDKKVLKFDDDIVRKIFKNS